MSNYPIWWDTDVTIYNKFTDPTTQIVKWYRTNISKCFWKYDRTKLSVGNTVIETTDTICRIPENENFVENFKWVNIPNDEMNNYFTLSVGDIVVKGNITDDIDEYKAGKRSSDLISKYKEMQGVIQVNQVSINTGIGRCLPHYLVRGQ